LEGRERKLGRQKVVRAGGRLKRTREKTGGDVSLNQFQVRDEQNGTSKGVMRLDIWKSEENRISENVAVE